MCFFSRVPFACVCVDVFLMCFFTRDTPWFFVTFFDHGLYSPCVSAARGGPLRPAPLAETPAAFPFGDISRTFPRVSLGEGTSDEGDEGVGDTSEKVPMGRTGEHGVGCANGGDAEGSDPPIVHEVSARDTIQV